MRRCEDEKLWVTAGDCLSNRQIDLTACLTGRSSDCWLNRQIDCIILTILLWMDGCPASAVRLLRIIVHACHDNRVMGKMSLLRTAPV